jgi:nucleoside-diphosphate kinase
MTPKEVTMEQTFAMIKPDSVKLGHIGHIISMIEKDGLDIREMVKFAWYRHAASLFYSEHDGQPFFPGLVTFTCSGPCIGLVLEGKAAVVRWRNLLGATKPENALDGTVRKLYGEKGTTR